MNVMRNLKRGNEWLISKRYATPLSMVIAEVIWSPAHSGSNEWKEPDIADNLIQRVLNNASDFMTEYPELKPGIKFGFEWSTSASSHSVDFWWEDPLLVCRWWLGCNPYFPEINKLYRKSQKPIDFYRDRSPTGKVKSAPWLQDGFWEQPQRFLGSAMHLARYYHVPKRIGNDDKMAKMDMRMGASG